LDVVEAASPQAKAEVKEYVNALREADRNIGELIQYFRHRPDSTIVAILGDHLPPLSKTATVPFFRNMPGISRSERARRLHRVPLVVWANFKLPHRHEELSTNALPSFILQLMGIRPAGFFAVGEDVRRNLPVISQAYIQGADGHMWDRDSLPRDKRHLLEDYRLLQYDLLLGHQYALDDGAPGRGVTPAP
jgi:phosphoglycerol transferase MdoB-like AlkP superfamily enzyme